MANPLTPHSATLPNVATESRPIDACASSKPTMLAVINLEIKAKRVSVYRNVLKNPKIEFYVAGNLEVYSLRDPSVEDYLIWLAVQAGSGIPTRSEVRIVLGYLRGLALNNPRYVISDPDVLKAIESDQLVAVLPEYLATKGLPFEIQIGELYKQLPEFKVAQKLKLKGRELPGGDNALSRRLDEIAPLLPAFGISSIWPKRTSKGQSVIFAKKQDECRSDDPAPQPSSGSSPHNKPSDKDLSQTDDLDQKLDAVCDQLPPVPSTPQGVST